MMSSCSKTSDFICAHEINLATKLHNTVAFAFLFYLFISISDQLNNISSLNPELCY